MNICFRIFLFIISSTTLLLNIKFISAQQQQDKEQLFIMENSEQQQESNNLISTLTDFAKCASYSLLENLSPNPGYEKHRPNKSPREVKSGHFVPVRPTPIPKPMYVAHSKQFFRQLGLADSLAEDEDFKKIFSGDFSDADSSKLPQEMQGDKTWCTGYALSILGQEYYTQDPFQTGNGYGDGRAVSVFEGVFGGEQRKETQRFEFQLKGGGRTPYCRGADGRAVLRSSIREFLAQEAMHSLGVPTTRSLTLYVSPEETVKRPWYSDNSSSEDPDILVSEPVAITTRVAPSFLRIGQLELFGRRARKKEHPDALKELKQIVEHAIEREYRGEISLNDKNSEINKEAYISFAEKFQSRLTSLIANWIRVGFVQGNFNADNTAVGGFTLDYGPFGFVDRYQPYFQMWTGGGDHFAFMNQPNAGKQNFKMFCLSLMPLFADDEAGQNKIQSILQQWDSVMSDKLNSMFASKMGLKTFRKDLFTEMEKLMRQTPVDYTIFFRELSSLPKTVDENFKKSFYSGPPRIVFSSLVRGQTVPMHPTYETEPGKIVSQWNSWLSSWHAALTEEGRPVEQVSAEMKKLNPRVIPKEFLVVPAYKKAMKQPFADENFDLVRELYDVFTRPYDDVAGDDKYSQKTPIENFDKGGTSHCSCSS